MRDGLPGRGVRVIKPGRSSELDGERIADGAARVKRAARIVRA
jgi:hypothetical protein